MKMLIYLLLIGAAFGQNLPKIPVSYQSKFKTLVIKQKDIQLDQAKLRAAYEADAVKMEAINAEGAKLEVQVLRELKLDPEKFTVQFKDDEMIVVENKESKPSAK